MHDRADSLVLDYAPAPRSAWSNFRRRVAALGPWIVWPSRRSWICLALLIAAAANVTWLPRRWELIDEFAARDDEPIVLAGTSRVMYRAPDHSLWVRDVAAARGKGAPAQVQLQPNLTHTEPSAAANGSVIARWSEEGELVFWDAIRGAQLGRLPPVAFNKNAVAPSNLGVSPEGTRVAAQYPGGRFIVWDVSDRQTAKVVAERTDAKDSAPFEKPQFSGDGRYLLFVGAKSAWIADADTLCERRRFDEERAAMYIQWAADGRRLVVTESESDTNWLVRVVDPADSRQADAHVTRLRLRFRIAFTSRDGNVLIADRSFLYAIPSGEHLLELDGQRRMVSAILPDGEAIIVNNMETRFAELVDTRTGVRIARVPSGSQISFLPDGRTVVMRDSDRRVRVRRLDLSRRPERSAWWSWRIWLMAPPAALLAVSLWRDARRRSSKPMVRFDAMATGTMIFAGVLALAMGLAQTAIDRNLYIDTWWSGDIVGVGLIVVMICGMGVVAGSRAWLWFTRTLLVIFTAIAALAAGQRLGATESFVVLDDLWTVSHITLRAMFAASAAAGIALAILIGRPVRAA